MKKILGLLLVTILSVMVCNVPVFSEENEREYEIYREYRDSLYMLQSDVTRLYFEVCQGKNPQAVYEHLLQMCEQTAELTGKAEEASHNLHTTVQVSLQDYLEVLLVLGLSEEQTQNLRTLGYTEEDISNLEKWFLYYNDSYHHAVTGFTEEEVERFHLLGLTDLQIAELQSVLSDHYTQVHGASEVVKQHQRELLQIQMTLSFAALQSLREVEKKKDKEKDSVLLNAEGKLLESILTISEDQPSLEHVKAFSKEVYKAAEQEIRKGNTQYTVDFFIGLQIYCGAVTALNGDPELGLREIQLYRNVLAECSSSPERPVQQVSYTQSGSVPPSSAEILDFVGQVEESDETNNMGSATVFVKTSDTSVWQAAVLLLAFISDVYGSTEWTLGGLMTFLEGCIEGISVTTLALGVAGAFILLIITAPAVGEEWPSAVPGYIEGDEIIIVVEGSYGQGHITDRAKSSNPCVASSHQAILDDKYKIQEIVVHALKLLYDENSGQYVYYYVDNMGKEWAVFIEEYENRYYQLITAYRADCSPFTCIDKDGTKHEYFKIIEKWLCEGFKLISLW